MKGRLWWRSPAAWGLELDGEIQPPARDVMLRGATVRTVVNRGGHQELPSAPAALIEFEADSVEVTPVLSEGHAELPNGPAALARKVLDEALKPVSPSNDNNAPPSAGKQS